MPTEELDLGGFNTRLEIEGRDIAGFHLRQRFRVSEGQDGKIIEFHHGYSSFIDDIIDLWRKRAAFDGAILCLDIDGETVVERYEFTGARVIPEVAETPEGYPGLISGEDYDGHVEWLRIAVQSLGENTISEP